MPSDRTGWVKFYRSMATHPVINKDHDHLAVWVCLLCSAAFEPTLALFGGKAVTLEPGQLTTGRDQLAANTKIESSKVYRILKAFESAQLIEQQTSNKNTLISIVWPDELRKSEQQNEQQVSNGRTTSEQQVNTLEERNNTRNQERGLFDDAI